MSAIRAGVALPTGEVQAAGAALWSRNEALWAMALIVSALLYYLPGNSFGGPPFLSHLAFLAPLGFVVLAALCYLRTELAILLLPLSFPFFMLPRHVGSHLEFSLSETLVLLCAAAVVVRALLRWPALPTDGGTGRIYSRGKVHSRLAAVGRELVPATIFEQPAALFVLAAVIATAGALFRSVALRELRVIIVEPALYYCLVVSLLRRPQLARGALYAAVAAGAIVALIAALQQIIPPLRSPLGSDGLPTMYGVYSHRNNLGLFLDRTVPMALVIALWSAHRKRLLGLFVTIGLVSVLALTPSRGAWLTSAVVCAGLIGLRVPRLRSALLALGIVGTLVLVLAELGLNGPLGHLVSLGHGKSTQARIYVWTSATHMIRDHPLLGVGPDNFLYYYSGWAFREIPGHPALPPGWVLPANRYNYLIPGHSYMLNEGKDEPFLSHPHNILLDAWLSTGVLGLAAMLWLLISFLQRCVVLYRTSRGGNEGEAERRTVLMASAAVLALVVHGLVDNSYFVIDLAMLFWLCLAVVAVAWRCRST